MLLYNVYFAELNRKTPPIILILSTKQTQEWNLRQMNWFGKWSPPVLFFFRKSEWVWYLKRSVSYLFLLHLALLYCIHRKLKTQNLHFILCGWFPQVCCLFLCFFLLHKHQNRWGDWQLTTCIWDLSCETARTEGMKEFFPPENKKHSWLFLPGFI